jgi:hypothetical protein
MTNIYIFLVFIIIIIISGIIILYQIRSVAKKQLYMPPYTPNYDYANYDYANYDYENYDYANYYKAIGGGELELTEEDQKYLLDYFNIEYSHEKIKKRLESFLYKKQNKNHKKNIGDIVIDTFNAIYFIKKNDKYISIHTICSSIEYMAIKLKKYFSGRIMFIIKDDENQKNNDANSEKYKELAKKLKIYIYVAESYQTNAPSWNLPNWVSKDIHSLKGRDDFATIKIAEEFNCPILSNDNYGDKKEFKYAVAPFKLLEYNWFSIKVPIVRQYKPENYKTIQWSKTLLKLDNIFMPKELAIIKLPHSE